jgi:hypothetical protein
MATTSRSGWSEVRGAGGSAAVVRLRAAAAVASAALRTGSRALRLTRP